MTTNTTLRRMIAKQTNITKLQKLIDTGFDMMVVLFYDFNESDKTELIPIVQARIIELS